MLELSVPEININRDQIIKISKKINEIALNSYKGLPSTAFAQLSNLLSSNKDKFIITAIKKEEIQFYRMRNIPEKRRGISYREMFHFPMNQRRKIQYNRYSTPGYPCLYLGESIYTPVGKKWEGQF